MSFSSWPVFHPNQPYGADQQTEAYPDMLPYPYMYASVPTFVPDPGYFSQPLDTSLNMADFQPGSQGDNSQLQRIEETLLGIQKEYVCKRSLLVSSADCFQVSRAEQVRGHPLSIEYDY